MRPIGTDCIKAQIQKMLLLLSARRQVIGSGNLGQRLLSHLLLDPVHEFCKRHAVLDVRFSGIGQLNRILDRFHPLRGILFVNYLQLRLEAVAKTQIGHRRIQPDYLIGRKACSVLVNRLR